MKRSPSAQTLEETPNKNTDWLDDRGFWVWYVILVFVLRFFVTATCWVLASSQWANKYGYSCVHIAHAVVTFILIHAVKGTPFWSSEDQGQYDNDTFWEQIDHGRQNTWNRKLFTIIPVVLFLAACYEAHWAQNATIVNLVFLAVEVLPKLDVFSAPKENKDL